MPIRRRPRRSNSLKDIGRLLGTAGTTYGEDEFLALAARLNNVNETARSNFFKIQRLNLEALGTGLKFIANDRVVHLLQERPGAIGDAWLINSPVRDALRHLRAQGLDAGASPQAKRRATELKKEINKARVALIEANHAYLAECEAEERQNADLYALIHEVRPGGHDWEARWQEIAMNKTGEEV